MAKATIVYSTSTGSPVNLTSLSASISVGWLSAKVADWTKEPSAL